MVEEEQVELVDLTIDTLNDPQCIFGLGAQAATALRTVGSCTFVLAEDGSIHLLNHFDVFINAKSAIAPKGVEPRFLRPILTNKRPQFVAIREDGSIWEVEYPDPSEIDGTDDTE
jgi:hypothetical protein